MATAHRIITAILPFLSLSIAHSARTNIEHEVDLYGLPDCATKGQAKAPRDSICDCTEPFPWASECSPESRAIAEEWFRRTCPEVVPVSFDSLPACAQDGIVSGSLERGCYALTQSCFCDVPDSEVMKYVDGCCSDEEYTQAREWHSSLCDCEPEPEPEPVEITTPLAPTTTECSSSLLMEPSPLTIQTSECESTPSRVEPSPSVTEPVPYSTIPLSSTTSPPPSTTPSEPLPSSVECPPDIIEPPPSITATLTTEFIPIITTLTTEFVPSITTTLTTELIPIITTTLTTELIPIITTTLITELIPIITTTLTTELIPIITTTLTTEFVPNITTTLSEPLPIESPPGTTGPPPSTIEPIFSPTTLEPITIITTVYATRTVTALPDQSQPSCPTLEPTTIITTVYATRTVTALPDQSQSSSPEPVVCSGPPPSTTTSDARRPAEWSPSDASYFLREPVSPGLQFAMTFLVSFGSFMGVITWYELLC